MSEHLEHHKVVDIELAIIEVEYRGACKTSTASESQL